MSLPRGTYLVPHLLSSAGVERAAVTETELSDVLVACQRCNAWPMSVNFGRSNRFEWAHRDLGLRCPACGHRENVLIDDQGAIIRRIKRRTPEASSLSYRTSGQPSFTAYRP